MTIFSVKYRKVQDYPFTYLSEFGPHYRAGQYNTAVGIKSLEPSTGSNNTAYGYHSLLVNTTGINNTAVGTSSLVANTTGNYNTGIGWASLNKTTTGESNTACGSNALQENTTGGSNTASGVEALYSNTTGSANLAFGVQSLRANTTGTRQTAIGYRALYTTQTSEDNTAVGYQALFDNTTGNDNTAVGRSALQENTTGDGNIALGNSAGSSLTTGDHNICIGNVGVAAESSTIRIGDSDQTKAYIAGIRGVTTGASDAVAVLIDSNGQLGQTSSSLRYKEDVTTMGDMSARLQELHAVTFRYKKPADDGTKPLQYGLIAEQVHEVMPELVVYDREGRPDAIQYHILPSLLLNEVQRLRQENDDLEERLTRLEDRLSRR